MSTLADQQAALVRALVARGELPAGFDPTRVQATISALLRKRTADVARVWPALLAEPPARTRFFAWADGRPKTTSYADGLDFARHEHAAGRLSDRAADELHRRSAAPRRRSRRRYRRWRQLIMR